MTAVQIAGLLHHLAVANHTLGAELDSIASTARPLNQSTVDHLQHVVELMRPAAHIRQILSELDPRDLLAGAREWHRQWPATPTPPGALGKVWPPTAQELSTSTKHPTDAAPHRESE